MASSQSTCTFILEQIAALGEVSARKMFGEYAIYCGGKTVALLCDDQLFVKKIAAGESFLAQTFHPIPEGFPYSGAKSHFVIPGDLWEDREWMCALIRVYADHLPLPRKRPTKSTKPVSRVVQK